MPGEQTPVWLRARLTQPRRLLSTFLVMHNHEIVELCALAGFDSVIVDCEHGPYGTEAVAPLSVAARSRGLYTVTRVRTNDASLIGNVLDAGSDGVLVPQICCVDDARAAIAAARFAPDGHRGANPFGRGADYGAPPSWFAEANSRTAVLLLIEGRQGIQALPQILELPGLDCVFVGPVDLSHSLGLPGQTDHPAVIGEVERIVESASQAGVATGVFAPHAAAARRWIGAGVRFIALGVDTHWALEGLKAAVGELGAL